MGRSGFNSKHDWNAESSLVNSSEQIGSTSLQEEPNPTATDDFGLFNYKNLPLLDKANREVIRKLRADAWAAQNKSSAATSPIGANQVTSPGSAGFEGNPVREGVATSHRDGKSKKGVPPGARWTKIKRKLVNPEALTIGMERFEVKDDFIIVFRVLNQEEIEEYVENTSQLRALRIEAGREGSEDGNYSDQESDRDGENIKLPIIKPSRAEGSGNFDRYSEVPGDGGPFSKIKKKEPETKRRGAVLEELGQQSDEEADSESSLPNEQTHLRLQGIELTSERQDSQLRAARDRRGSERHQSRIHEGPTQQLRELEEVQRLQDERIQIDEEVVSRVRQNQQRDEGHILRREQHDQDIGTQIREGRIAQREVDIEQHRMENERVVEFDIGVRDSVRNWERNAESRLLAEPRRQDDIAAKLESKGEASPDPAIIGTSELDEMSSVPSYNDSIFDDLESVLSSMSSLDNGTQTVFVGAFVDLLIRDPTVDTMIARATSDTGIGAERFRRSFSRILKTYSRDLRDTITQQQQREHKPQRVATFIGRKTMQASSLLVTRYKERAPKSDNNALDKVAEYLDGLESNNSDSSNDEGPDTELTIAGLETFLLQGKPFKALKWRLRSLVIPNQRVTQVKFSAEHLLDFMFGNLGLEETFARAYGLVPNFHTWLQSNIVLLAASLETELKEAKFPVAEYLRTYSVYLSAEAIRKLRQTIDVSYTQDSEPSSHGQRDEMYSTGQTSSQEILEDIMAERLPEVFGGDFSQDSVWTRLLSTKAFRDFFSNLSDAAYPTFFSECRKVLKAEIDSQAPHPSAQSEERYLLSMLLEQQWCLARHDRKFSLSFQSSDRVVLVDRLKLAIERSTGSEWNWWPLSPPPRAVLKPHVQLEPLDLRQQFPANILFSLAQFPGNIFLSMAISFAWGFAEPVLLGPLILLGVHVPVFYFFGGALAISIAISLVALPSTRSKRSKGCPERSVNQEEHAGCTKVMLWICACGSARRELISPKYADLFRQLMSQYPTTHNNNNPIQVTNLSVPKVQSQSSSGDSTSSPETQSVGSVDSAGGGSGQASVLTAPSSTGSTTITLDLDTQAFVHLLVRKADRYILSSIKVTDKDARGFFHDLIVRYHRHRGYLRRIFSIFVYSHCDFVKIKHHRAHRFSPIPGFSFPEPGKDAEYHEYTYSPQPMMQAPITKHMFNDFFYSCYDRNNLKHSFLHKFVSCCDVIETLSQDLLESMPKRDREVLAGAQYSRVEHFWGIVAREERSALRVVLYMLLSLMPTIWFMFMWLFSWGHEGDLQNATVPVTISIATLSMVWIVVYSGSEIRDKEF